MDYTEAFEKVQHKDLFEVLGKLELFEEGFIIMHNLYWNESVCIWITHELDR